MGKWRFVGLFIRQSAKIIGVFSIQLAHLCKKPAAGVFNSCGDTEGSGCICQQNDACVKGRLVAGYNLLFIDEAQRIPNIGLNLKIMHDNIPELKIIATGSSSFELANQISEPLTGRTWTYTLYPMSVLEWKNTLNPFEIVQKLPEFLTFGMYPEVFSYGNDLDKMDYLKELSTSFLYRDLLELSQIKNAGKIHDLLRLLAFQIGSPVSYNELGRQLGLSTDTVISYVDLLEKVFVIFKLSGFSKNLRKEITKNKKIYFYARVNPYFWRTYTGAELDFIEQGSGKLLGFEIKWGSKTAKVPASWRDNYPKSEFNLINMKNFQEFVAE